MSENTSVENMLIEMITPKVQEIEERFCRGEGLSSEDINTLLLKSQYNHINHLDKRLDEVTASVVGLEGKFVGLEGKFVGLEGKFVALEGKFDLLRSEVNARLDTFEAKMEAFETRIELKISEAINKNMRFSIALIMLIVIVLKLADMFVK